MPELRGLRGLRYDEQVAGSLATLLCPPYDVIEPAERRELAARSPYNAVHVELPEPDESGSEFAHAARLLRQWRLAGVLRSEAAAAIYPYEHRFTWAGREHVRRGFFAAVTLVPWEAGMVLPHEYTYAGPKANRLQLLRATATQLSPVFGLLDAPSSALAALWCWAEGRPLAAEAHVESETHRLWVLDEPELLAQLARALRAVRVVIADGHHRYETALAYAAERAASGAAGTGPWEAVLMLCVPADDTGLVVLPTHRLVRWAGEATLAELATPLFEAQEVQIDPLRDPDTAAADLLRPRPGDPSAHVFLLAEHGRPLLRLVAYPAALELLPAARAAAWRALDVAVVHHLLIDRLPGLELGYTRSAAAALDEVRRGGTRAALLLNPTPPAQVIAVAAAGERMPQKSTYFHPKVPTGLIFYDLAEAEA